MVLSAYVPWLVQGIQEMVKLKPIPQQSSNTLIDKSKIVLYGSDTKYKNEFAMLILMLNDELWSKLRESMLQHKIYDKPNLCKMV